MSNETLTHLPWPFELEMPLRWSDQDVLGHVNNARIITLIEEARIRWTRGFEPDGRFKFGTVVATLTINYLRPVHYQPEFRIQMAVTRIGTKSFTVRHVGIQNDAATFDCTTVMVALAEDGVSSRALNDTERAWLEAELMSAPV